MAFPCSLSEAALDGAVRAGGNGIPRVNRTGLSEAALDGAVRAESAPFISSPHRVSVKPRSMARCEVAASIN